MYKGYGTILAKENRLTLEINDDLSRYYRSLIPKWLGKPNPQMYAPHISIIRHEFRRFSFDELSKYNGEVVEFFYDGTVERSSTYWWLNIFSHRLESIRTELGLTTTSNRDIMSGYRWMFHLTIGNEK